MPVDTVVAFETPERVVFRHAVAGPAARSVAWAVDAVIQVSALAVVAAFGALLGIGFGALGAGVAVGLGLIALFLAQWLYGAFFEWWAGGRTPGKALLGLRVVRADGGPIDGRQALLRNLMRGADALPFAYGVGVVVMAVDPRQRRLGDLVADTMVVRTARSRLASEHGIVPPVTEAEWASLPPRVVLTREERQVIVGMQQRAAVLGEARLDELAGVLAPGVTARTGVVGAGPWRTLQLALARSRGERPVDPS